jgi:hypothetical protein
VVPGEGFIRTTPNKGNMKKGTEAMAGLFAAWLAGLAISPDMLSDLPPKTEVILDSFAGHKGFQTQVRGKSLVVFGISLKLGVQATPVTRGVAAPPEMFDEVKRVAEDIVRQIDAKDKRAKLP